MLYIKIEKPDCQISGPSEQLQFFINSIHIHVTEIIKPCNFQKEIFSIFFYNFVLIPSNFLKKTTKLKYKLHAVGKQNNCW